MEEKKVVPIYSLDRDCEKHGCAKACMEPKLRVFDDCFPQNIRLGDADGIIERKGHILILEWKHYDDPSIFEVTSKAQRIMAQAFVNNNPKQQWWFILGDPQTMDAKWGVKITADQPYNPENWTEINLRKLQATLRHWYQEADKG